MTPQGQPLNIDFVFTRKMLEDLTKDLVDRTVGILQRVMARVLGAIDWVRDGYVAIVRRLVECGAPRIARTKKSAPAVAMHAHQSARSAPTGRCRTSVRSCPPRRSHNNHAEPANT